LEKLDRNCWKIKEKIKRPAIIILQTREGCAYWGENKRAAAIILHKREGCAD
jgi:hypothetical protein